MSHMPTALVVLLLGGLACSVPYVLLRKIGGMGRTLRAYGAGFLASSATSLGMLLTTQGVLAVPIHDADRVIGSGLLCAVVGPVVGVLAAKRSRSRLQRPPARQVGSPGSAAPDST
jgi:hypothetical protein